MTGKETTMYNIYDDDPKTKTTQSDFNIELLIFLDFEKQSVSDLIKSVRDVVMDKPDGTNIQLYIISGYECKPDIDIFVNYLSTLQYDFTIIIRGIIHPYFIQLLEYNEVRIEQNSKLIYRKEHLHDLLKNLIKNSNVFRTTIQFFIEKLNTVHESTLLDVTDLKSLGFKFQTY